MHGSIFQNRNIRCIKQQFIHTKFILRLVTIPRQQQTQEEKNHRVKEFVYFVFHSCFICSSFLFTFLFSAFNFFSFILLGFGYLIWTQFTNGTAEFVRLFFTMIFCWFLLIYLHCWNVVLIIYYYFLGWFYQLLFVVESWWPTSEVGTGSRVSQAKQDRLWAKRF